MSRSKELIRMWHENIELWKVHLEEISAQPEQETETKQENTQYLLDQVSRLTAENAMLKEKVFERPELSTNSLQFYEPVAWMWEDKRNETNSRATVCCTRKPDNSVHVKNVVPLYAPPPKREPLSDTRCPYPKETSGEYRDGFTDGILYAEKQRGIFLE